MKLTRSQCSCFFSICPGKPFDTGFEKDCSGYATAAPSMASTVVPSSASATKISGTVFSTGASTSTSSTRSILATATTTSEGAVLAMSLGKCSAIACMAAIVFFWIARNFTSMLRLGIGTRVLSLLSLTHFKARSSFRSVVMIPRTVVLKRPLLASIIPVFPGEYRERQW